MLIGLDSQAWYWQGITENQQRPVVPEQIAPAHACIYLKLRDQDSRVAWEPSEPWERSVGEPCPPAHQPNFLSFLCCAIDVISQSRRKSGKLRTPILSPRGPSLYHLIPWGGVTPDRPVSHGRCTRLSLAFCRVQDPGVGRGRWMNEHLHIAHFPCARPPRALLMISFNLCCSL